MKAWFLRGYIDGTMDEAGEENNAVCETSCSLRSARLQESGPPGSLLVLADVPHTGS